MIILYYYIILYYITTLLQKPDIVTDLAWSNFLPTNLTLAVLKRLVKQVKGKKLFEVIKPEWLVPAV